MTLAEAAIVLQQAQAIGRALARVGEAAEAIAAAESESASAARDMDRKVQEFSRTLLNAEQSTAQRIAELQEVVAREQVELDRFRDEAASERTALAKQIAEQRDQFERAKASYATEMSEAAVKRELAWQEVRELTNARDNVAAELDNLRSRLMQLVRS